MIHIHTCPGCYEDVLCAEACHIEPDLGTKNGHPYAHPHTCDACENQDTRVVLPGRVDVWRWEIGKRVVLQRPWREGGPRDIDTWKLFHEHVELRDGDSLRRTVNGEQVVYRGLVNVSHRREVVTLLPQDST